jgi:hypothetical protein
MLLVYKNKWKILKEIWNFFIYYIFLLNHYLINSNSKITFQRKVFFNLNLTLFFIFNHSKKREMGIIYNKYSLNIQWKKKQRKKKIFFFP